MHHTPLHKTAPGFTLVEILIALLVLAIGILGISHYTSQALVSISDNNARATSLDFASGRLEPLYLAASQGIAAFSTALGGFNSNVDTNGDGITDDITVTGTNGIGQDNYVINILNVVDKSGTVIYRPQIKSPAPVGSRVAAVDNLGALSTSGSPFTAAVSVTYQGLNDRQGQVKRIVTHAPFTFIVTKP